MKKLALKLVTVLTAIALLTGAMTGCGLFEVDTDRDMAQKVATVCIDKNELDTDVIYKRDMVAGYYSYGYYYVNNYGYTKAKTYEMILDNLISNSIVVQSAKKDLAKTYFGEADYANLLTDLETLKEKGFLSLLATDAEIEEFNKKTSLARGSDDYYSALNAYVYDLYKDKSAVSAKDAPFRFVSRTALNSSSVIRTIRLSRVIPALLTRMSTLPYFSVTAFTKASLSAKSATLHFAVSAIPPWLRMSVATASAASAEPL